MNQDLDLNNKDFFSKLWKCPFRRWWRYGRRLMTVYLVAVLVWIGLDFTSEAFLLPGDQHTFIRLIAHALLTVGISLILTHLSHQLYLRLRSRFRTIKAYPVKSKSQN